MTLRLIGGALIVAACGGYGLALGAAHRQKERELERLIEVIAHMESQLSYQLTPLPELCRQAARGVGGPVGEVFRNLALALDQQSAPEVSGCMAVALSESRPLPPGLGSILTRLGAGLGRYDLPGQLRGLRAARQACRRQLDALEADRDVRLRSYRTLGLCAGAALVILLI